jgi:uncharacterized membrane protein YhfC
MRWAVYSKWAKDARTWSKGVLFGTGHGGIEAILLGLLVLVTYVQIVALTGSDISAVVPADQLALAQQQVASYWAYPWPVTLLGALERLFTLPLHIACAVLVLQTFLRKQARWFWFAVLWHALADATVVYLARLLPQGQISTFFILEIPTGVAALVSLAIILALRTPEPDEQVEMEPPAGIPAVAAYNLPVKEETSENLEETRYQ